eukprot:4155504-Prymnesium_polylepis.2
MASTASSARAGPSEARSSSAAPHSRRFLPSSSASAALRAVLRLPRGSGRAACGAASGVIPT